MDESNSFVVLFDYDSMIYKAVWRIASISDMKSWFREGKTREWMTQEIIHLTVNRMSNMGDAILLDIEDTGINIQTIEYFLTSCKNSVRKTKVKTYKANRKRNKWVNLVRQYIIDMGFTNTHDEWEADDLIKERCIELGVDKYVICTIDKDLKQIPGIHFDYYRPVLKNPDGSFVRDEFGNRSIAPCRGLSIQTEDEANLFFWSQMLAGDSGDNIKGIRGIGLVKAAKILEDSDNYEKTVKEKYTDYFGQEEGQEQFELHRLMIGLGIENRP